MRLFDEVLALDPCFPSADEQRSSNPAIHLGVWSHYRMTPVITGEMRQIRLNPPSKREPVMRAFHNLCGAIKKHVLPKLTRLMDEYYPEQRRTRELVRKRIHQYLGEELKKWPHFDFDGVFTTIAVKEGATEVWHVDWGDPLARPTLVFCIGEYTGGQICFPQLDSKVSFLPGSALAFLARLVGHCSAPHTGRRIVFTCFTDNTLLEHALQNDV
ncbi:hypothetical protein GGX14DRAFT_343678 [Mycena pura]|uniref:Uncharacterized protein n=1 Tax=Mycena pura TaxID=153505 RepID=A0AAD7E5A0_9AGAR|nr:hypothetical protein GGX14DRAFT_343678 [Mycena pura]